MSLFYQRNGNLYRGVYPLTWEEFEKEFGFNSHRKKLIDGLKLAASHLKKCGCKRLYIGGSFASKKVIPQDTDVCYDLEGVNLLQLRTDHPAFFDKTRKSQKQIYLGEFFPKSNFATPPPNPELYIDFLQHDKEGNPRGVIELKL